MSNYHVFRNPVLWFREFSYWTKQQWQTFTPWISSSKPGVSAHESWQTPPPPSWYWIWPLLNLQPDSLCTFSPSINKKLQFLQLTIPHMNGGVENRRKYWKGGGKVRIVLFDWKQLVGLHYHDVLRIDEGSADLILQLGIILFHSLRWYSQSWFINSQLCVLTRHWTCFFLDGQSTVMFKILCLITKKGHLKN